MELLQLRYFRDAATYENFSDVARIHMVPQPYISKTIKKLENELNTTLFERNGKRVSLNSNGRFFLSKIDEALTLIDEGIAEFSDNKPTALNVYVQAGSRFASLIIADYMEQTDNTYITPIYNTKNNNDFHFTFIQKENVDESLIYESLIDDEIKVAVHKDLPLATQESVSIEELSTMDFIGYYKTIGIRSFTDKYCEDHGFTPNVVYETSDTMAFSYMLQKKKGIALVPSATWTLNYNDSIVLIPLKEKISRELVIAWDKKKRLTKEEKSFLEYTKKWVQTI